jgi:hypothetical protein
MASDYYFTRDGKQYGPVSASQLRTLAETGRLQPTDKVRKEGMANWVAASSVKGLFTTPGPVSVPPLYPESASAEEPVVVAEVVEAEIVETPDEGKLGKAGKRVAGDWLTHLKFLASNPLQNLAEAYDRLGPQKALGVGLGAAGVFVLCFVLWVYFVMPWSVMAIALSMSSGETSPRRQSTVHMDKPWKDQEVKTLVRSLFIGLVIPTGIFLGSLATRKLFQGAGAIESDVFLAGLSVVPAAALNCLAEGFFVLLRVGLMEAYFALMFFDICVTVLIVYKGCSQLNKLTDRASIFAAPLIAFIPLVFLDLILRFVVA